MSANTTIVFRDEYGREKSRQSFTDPEQANRVMIARNRVEVTLGTAWRWGIETEHEVVECRVVSRERIPSGAFLETLECGHTNSTARIHPAELVPCLSCSNIAQVLPK